MNKTSKTSKTRVINIFGGPGVGKSTTASGIFYKLKLEGYNVEYVSEFAKELTFGKDYTKLSDQLLIFGEQHHRIYKLRDEVDIIVNDSPFVMGLAYLNHDDNLPEFEFTQLIVKLFKSYNNINFMISRNETQKYSEVGRNQNLDQAIQKDVEITHLLNSNYIEYTKVENSLNIVDELLIHIRKSLK